MDFIDEGILFNYKTLCDDIRILQGSRQVLEIIVHLKHFLKTI